MRRRLLKTLLVIATVTVVWLLVAPSEALAMPLNGAPVCDVRGATTFAPPPQIQDAELSFDIPADCLDIAALDLRLVKVVGQGHSAPPELTSTQEPVSVANALRFDLVFTERLPAPVYDSTSPAVGVRLSLERPPQG